MSLILIIYVMIVLPIVAAILIGLAEGVLVRNVVIITISALMLVSVYYLRHVYLSNFGYFSLNNIHLVVYEFMRIGHGLTLRFMAEPLGIAFAVLATTLWFPNVVYAIGYMDSNKEERQNSFFIFLFLAITCVMGIAFSGNVLTLLLFYELLTVVTYPLVTHHRNPKATRKGTFYVIELMAPSVLLLIMAAVIYCTGSSLDFSVGGTLPPEQFKSIGWILTLLCIYGVTKAASVPLHGWLPAAMVAPTPVSALLHAVAVVKAGTFTVIKITVYLLGIENLRGTNFLVGSVFSTNIMQLVACVSMLWGTFCALRATEIKKILAYSTVVNLAYIVGALSVFSEDGIRAAMFHMVGHGYSKITLFFAAGAIYTGVHVVSYNNLSGIARRMPITALCSAVAVASMMGVPFTVGYISKFNIIAKSSSYLVFVVSVIISTLGAAIYFSRMMFAMQDSSSECPKEATTIREVPWTIIAPMVCTTLAIILLFAVPGLVGV